MRPTAREPLTRDLIISTALALIDADGPDKLSMRRLGQTLGVDPMAVYYYLPNKAALYDGIVEHLWGAVTLPPSVTGETWQGLLTALFTEFRAVLLKHPRAVVIVGTRPSVTAPLLRLIDVTLGRLGAAGLSGPDAMQLIDCLSGYTIGKVMAEVGESLGGLADTVATAMAEVTPQTHPNLVAVMASGYVLAPDEEFDRGLRALITGWS